MKRSEINTIIADTEDFIKLSGMILPPFAFWDPDQLRTFVRKHACRDIVKFGLGWTVTDFGLGNFIKHGLVVFTTRMGDYQNITRGKGKVYAEKVLVQRKEQKTPLHYHRAKTEDIINRSDSTFQINLYHATDTGEINETERLAVNVDGQDREFIPGENINLKGGESLTIEPKIYHEFTAVDNDVLAVEISSANDDINDNFFYDPVGVANVIDEDEDPRYLLVQDYEKEFLGLLK